MIRINLVYIFFCSWAVNLEQIIGLNIALSLACEIIFWLNCYREMHFSAKRGIAIAYRPFICPSVRNVGGSGSHKLEILETNCTYN